MVYATGDTHGNFLRFTPEYFPRQKRLTAENYVIICGDFGGVWDGNEKSEAQLDWLNTLPFTTLFIDGNHENFDLLSQYPVTQWNGGKVHIIRKKLIHLMRGQVYTLHPFTHFTMGGGSSHDISDGILEPDEVGFEAKRKALDRSHARYRINHRTWWAEELPSDAEYAEALANLERTNWDVDFIITHCAPSSISNMLSGGKNKHDRLTDFLETAKSKCSFDGWLFEHYHDNQMVDDRFALLWEQIVALC